MQACLSPHPSPWKRSVLGCLYPSTPRPVYPASMGVLRSTPPFPHPSAPAHCQCSQERSLGGSGSLGWGSTYEMKGQRGAAGGAGQAQAWRLKIIPMPTWPVLS